MVGGFEHESVFVCVMGGPCVTGNGDDFGFAVGKVMELSKVISWPRRASSTSDLRLMPWPGGWSAHTDFQGEFCSGLCGIWYLRYGRH